MKKFAMLAVLVACGVSFGCEGGTTTPPADEATTTTTPAEGAETPAADEAAE